MKLTRIAKLRLRVFRDLEQLAGWATVSSVSLASLPMRMLHAASARSMPGPSGRRRAQADSVALFKLATPMRNAVWDAFSRLVVPAFKTIEANAEALLKDCGL